MTAPAPSTLDQQVSGDDLIRELEVQLGAALGQTTRLMLLLRKRDEEVTFLREQLAAHDASEPPATRD